MRFCYDTRMREYLEHLTENFVFPALAVDERGALISANAAAMELFPLLEPGRPASAAIRGKSFANALGDVLSGGKSALAIVDLKRPKRRLEAHMSALSARPGGSHVFIHFRDRSQEQSLARMRMNFIASASHELRTPVAAILGLAETLRGAARDDEAARESFLAHMEQQALRMKKLVDDMLSLSRIEADGHKLPAGEADLNLIARRAAELLHDRAAAAGVRIELRLHDGAALVRGDAGQIEQIVLNLVENAIVYGGDGGKVRIRVRRGVSKKGAARLALSVRDWGAGILKKHIPRLTERFYRVDKSASRKAGGTGLGLAIVKHLAARHGARLKIASKKGKGAKFTVIFPALAE